MGNLNSVGLTAQCYNDQSSVPNAGEVKERYEAETKEKALPFDVVVLALANLPQVPTIPYLSLGQRVSRLLRGISSDTSREDDLPIIDALKNQNNPELQQSIETLIELYKQINNKVNKMDTERKNLHLATLAKKLFKVGDYDKASELLKDMGYYGNYKDETIIEFTKQMVKIGDLKKAFEYIEMIKDNNKKDNLIKGVVGFLIRAQRSIDAGKFLVIVTDPALKKQIFREIANSFTPETQIEVIIDLINIMPYDEKDFYTVEVVSNIIDLNNIEKILPLLNTLTKTSTTALAFWNISMVLKKSGDLVNARTVFEKARVLFNKTLLKFEEEFTLAIQISDVSVRDEYLRVLTTVLFFLIARPNINERLVFTFDDDILNRDNRGNNIEEENVRAKYFEKILNVIIEMSTESRDSYIKKRVGVFLNLNLISEASVLCNLMSDSQEKNELWAEIQRVENVDYVDSIVGEFFNAEPSNKTDRLAFKIIDVVIENNYEEAIKIANAMVDPAVKSLTLLKISNYLQIHKPEQASLIYDLAYDGFAKFLPNLPQEIKEVYTIEDANERDQAIEIMVLMLLFDISPTKLVEVDELVKKVQDPKLKKILMDKADKMAEAYDNDAEDVELDQMLFS